MNASYAALIGALELAQHVGDPDWIVVDCRADLVDKDFRVATNTIVILGVAFALALIGMVADMLVQLNKRPHDVMPATIE